MVAAAVSVALRRVSCRGRVARGRLAATVSSSSSTATTPGRRTLFLDPCRPVLLERLVEHGCETSLRGSEESVVQALQRTRPEIIVVRSSNLKDAELEAASEALKSLAFVMRAGAGVDNIAVKSLTRQGVVVANAAGANAVAVAELTMAHLLNLDRQVYDQVALLRQGIWRRREFANKARGLYGSSLAVLGVGAIGREVIKLGRAFGMEVRAWSRSLSKEEAAELGAVWCASPAEAVDGAYALAVHLPISDSTRGIVSDDLLRRLAKGGLVVNMSRGGVVDESALLRAVEECGLRAGLDVFDREPPEDGRDFEDAAISGCEAIYGTHHTGARTAQAAQAVEDAVVTAIDAFVSGRAVPGVHGRVQEGGQPLHLHGQADARRRRGAHHGSLERGDHWAILRF